MKEYKGTFRDNKMWGYCIFIGKDEDKKASMYRIGEMKDNVWMGKRTDYYGSGTVKNKIYSKNPNPDDDFQFGPEVTIPEKAFFGTGKPNNKE